MSDYAQEIHLGFLGLGHMGLPMAKRLLGKGVRLHVFDPSEEAMASMVAAGALSHESPASVADFATIVMACLPNRAISTQVAFGDDGVLQGRSIRHYVEMSTIGGECIQSIARALAARDIHTVDAPISGGPPAAKEGALTIMVSGATSDIAVVRPWLSRLGKALRILGDQPGLAQTMKLVNNLIMATNVVVAAEALVLGIKAGLQADSMMEVLSTSTGGSVALSHILARTALLGRFDFGAALSIVAKDVELGLDEASRLKVPLAVTEKAGELWQAAMHQGHGNEDFSSIVKLIEQAGGAVVRGIGAERAPDER